MRHQVAAAIAREKQLAGRGQQSATAALAVIRTSPLHFTGLVIDGCQEAAAGSDL